MNHWWLVKDGQTIANSETPYPLIDYAHSKGWIDIREQTYLYVDLRSNIIK